MKNEPDEEMSEEREREADKNCGLGDPSQILPGQDVGRNARGRRLKMSVGRESSGNEARNIWPNLILLHRLSLHKHKHNLFFAAEAEG